MPGAAISETIRTPSNTMGLATPVRCVRRQHQWHRFEVVI
ncbi:hypothetical protein NSU_pLA1108 (plasmid) [Novosphingobium pentaromativorans US6-1]|uniref:Uncharacterized protein n=1 Tax=Novosphingobium pentaromativorans US6-1 TaxID=1088721 RepID=G6EL35_9SPHN|nr:hypothetical protein NSU_pLA1108 [Novosphingobium pentaromativorans US6-1]